MLTERKLFTAELQRLQNKAGGATSLQPATRSSDDEVLAALREMRSDIKVLERLVRGEDLDEVQATAPEIDHELARKAEEMIVLKTELRALAVCIEQTKSEIAALRPRDSNEDRLIAVTFELDAIVEATETATESILEVAEKIEGIAREIQSHGNDPYVKRLTEDISETIVSLYEACNFQDITGQRITKVVKTLKYVEERVNAMIGIWGAEAISEIVQRPPGDTQQRGGDDLLLNGPALANQGINQSEIDALFG